MRAEVGVGGPGGVNGNKRQGKWSTCHISLCTSSYLCLYLRWLDIYFDVITSLFLLIILMATSFLTDYF